MRIATQTNNAAPEVQKETLSIMDMIIDGGTGNIIIIGVLFLMLSVTLYIYFECTFTIKAASQVNKTSMYKIRDCIAVGRLDATKVLRIQSSTPVTCLIEKGISRIGKPLEDINRVIENAGTLEVYKLEKNTAILAAIAGAGPMIGFSGTVVGMIMSFREMATASKQVEMRALTGDIYTAMATTVAGLIVGIITCVGYSHLVVKTDEIVHQVEANAVEFLDLLSELL